MLWIKVAFLALLATASNAGLIRRTGVNPSRQGGYSDMTSGNGGTYPRVNFLNDGSLIGTYAEIIGNDKQLTLVRSTDQGASWSFLGSAAKRPAAESDLDNPYVLQLPSGRVVIAFRNHDKDPDTGAYTYFRIVLSYSDDNGRTWKYLSTPSERDGGSLGIWEPFLRTAGNGDLQVYFSQENAANDQDSIEQISRDGGGTWGPQMTISGAGITARDGMIGVAYNSGSNLIAVFESEQGGTFQIDSVRSPDDGGTWGDRRTVYIPYGDNNNAGAPQVINVGGTLVTSFMTDEDTQRHHWIDGAAAKLITSGDGGNTWTSSYQIFAPQANWPGMVTLDGSSFLYVADYGGAKAQRVALS